jgi:hypothetical protein
MSALNLIPSGIDSLSDNLREFSTHLRELKFKSTPLPFDFLCPLEIEGEPTRRGLFQWPHLKTVEVTNMPGWLPSGKESLSDKAFSKPNGN